MDKNRINDIKVLIDNARSQGDKINLSTIIITLKCNAEDLPEIMNYFVQEGIEVINEDVEVDADYSINENSLSVSPFDPSKIDIKMDRITIDSIIKRIKHEELEFNSSFQRKAGLWNQVQKSQLIESLILRIPLPAFYFDAYNDDHLQIIDGLQRISTIRDYVINQDFVLTGMEFLKDLNNLKFDELPRSLQRRIEETNLNVYYVGPSTPKNVKFNIFKRINTGGLVLEPQEIRNALYQGESTEFLLELSQYEEFKEATMGCIKSERMLDREFCLRFVLVTMVGFENYTGNFDEYLNSGMEYLNRASEKELNQIRTNFKRDMKKCNMLLGKYAFRRINEAGNRGPINKALFEVWSYLINKLSDEAIDSLCKKRQTLLKEYSVLCGDYYFINDIKSTDKSSMINKFNKVEKLINNILGDKNDN